ncbi:MAG: DUF3021 domain-containing protein [Lachnospiraceae bacterium]|jgi:hypothetical protein|nr:DUF3021 domain-containing protein [Lachnospiraceae bacterium]
MTLKEIGKNMWHDYFVIVTGMLLSEAVFRQIFYAEAIIEHLELWRLLAGGWLFCMPHFIFYSRTELTKKQWLVRLAIHFCTLEVIVVGSARYLFGWLENDSAPVEYLVLATMVLMVYAVVMIGGGRRDRASADEINRRLGELKREEDKGSV